MNDSHERHGNSLTAQSKRTYSAPTLRIYGDIHDITLGSTTGTMGEGGGAPKNRKTTAASSPDIYRQ